MVRPPNPADDEPLVRGLNLPAAVSLVVGVVIGSGIFIGANRVAQGVTSIWMVFAIWIGAGLLTLLGALTYAEFGAALPKSGGDYVYIRQGIGPGWGFLSGWITFFINLPASIGALALAFAAQLESLKPGSHGILLVDGFAVKFTAVTMIVIFTVINYVGVKRAGATQTVLTILKLVLIAAVVFVGLSRLGASGGNLVPFFSSQKPAAAGGLALALVGALWAYDGWSGVARVAAEVKDPARNLPRALTFGIITVITIYVLIMLSYVVVLGLDGAAGTGDSTTDRLIASRAAEAVLGGTGATVVAIIIMVSILGPLNGLTLSGPRVYYAMARDRLFPAMLGKVHRDHKTPHISIVFQGAIAAVLAIVLSFETLTSYVVLAAWVQYALTAVALIRLRNEQPNLERPYKVPFYPWIPLGFILLATSFLAWLVLSSILNIGRDPATFWYTMVNVLVIAAAYPAWRLVQAFRASPDVASRPPA